MAKRLTGQARLPILEIDGRRVHDSTRIIAALEERVSQPPLYPADPELRERALALEDFFDEKVARPVRAFIFQHASHDPADMLAALMPNAGGAKKAVMHGFFAAVGPSVRKHYRATADDIRRGMDRLEREIGPSGYLAGDEFSVADLAGAAMFTPLMTPPQRPHPPRSLPPEVQALREELTARPGGQWIFEMYARHR